MSLSSKTPSTNSSLLFFTTHSLLALSYHFHNNSSKLSIDNMEDSRNTVALFSLYNQYVCPNILLLIGLDQTERCEYYLTLCLCRKVVKCKVNCKL